MRLDWIQLDWTWVAGGWDNVRDSSEIEPNAPQCNAMRTRKRLN